MAQAGAARGVLKTAAEPEWTPGPDQPVAPRLLNWIPQCNPRDPNGGLRIKTMYPGLPVANIQEKY